MKIRDIYQLTIIVRTCIISFDPGMNIPPPLPKNDVEALKLSIRMLEQNYLIINHCLLKQGSRTEKLNQT